MEPRVIVGQRDVGQTKTRQGPQPVGMRSHVAAEHCEQPLPLAGAHQCVGQRYALNHLVIFMALLASLIDFRRERTEGCDVPVYMPTIVPRDGCVVHLKQRCAKLPSF